MALGSMRIIPLDREKVAELRHLHDQYFIRSSLLLLLAFSSAHPNLLHTPT